jgi:hypothetical protein
MLDGDARRCREQPACDQERERGDDVALAELPVIDGAEEAAKSRLTFSRERSGARPHGACAR